MDLHLVTRFALFGNEVDDLLDLLILYQRALRADGFGRARGLIKHVAFAEQFLRAHLIENHTTINLGRHLEGDAAWDVCFDHAGNHLHARALGGHDAVDAGGPGHLRDARDGVLHLSRRGKHEIGQLINYHDDIAELVWNLQFLLTRYGDLLIDLHGKAVLTSLDPFFGTAKERQLRLGFRQRFLR